MSCSHIRTVQVIAPHLIHKSLFCKCYRLLCRGEDSIFLEQFKLDSCQMPAFLSHPFSHPFPVCFSFLGSFPSYIIWMSSPPTLIIFKFCFEKTNMIHRLRIQIPNIPDCWDSQVTDFFFYSRIKCKFTQILVFHFISLWNASLEKSPGTLIATGVI